MPNCELHYIPKRLHWEDKPILNLFDIGDYIYRRAQSDKLETPFKSISLREISSNIGTCNLIEISKPEDVLLNIDINNQFETYENYETYTLEIKELLGNVYIKEFYTEHHKFIVKLIHDPLPCMYCHCVFRIWFNNEIVTKTNYESTLGKKKFRKIRTKIRQELGSMIRRKEIRINFN